MSSACTCAGTAAFQYIDSTTLTANRISRRAFTPRERAQQHGDPEPRKADGSGAGPGDWKLHLHDRLLHAVETGRLQEDFAARPRERIAVRFHEEADLAGDQMCTLGQPDA